MRYSLISTRVPHITHAFGFTATTHSLQVLGSVNGINASIKAHGWEGVNPSSLAKAV